jgi:hypothetical protein
LFERPNHSEESITSSDFRQTSSHFVDGGQGIRFLSLSSFIYFLFDFFVASEARFGGGMMLPVSELFLFVLA